MTADSSYLNIRFETLQQAQDDLGAAYAAIQATVENLETSLNTNLSEWTGSAQQAYQQAQIQWHSALTHMASVLQKAQVHIGNAAEMYQAVENQNTSIWHS